VVRLALPGLRHASLSSVLQRQMRKGAFIRRSNITEGNL
jgi:hypothetical protein